MSDNPITARVAAACARPFGHTIANTLHDSETHYDVLNPATEKVVARAPEASREQLDMAVRAARDAQASWAAQSVSSRREALARLAQGLRDHLDELSILITLEQGKPLSYAVTEVERAAAQIERTTAIPLEDEVLRNDAEGRVVMRYRALGVVGGITPWNVPLILAIAKVVHALYTGNTLVLKPSEYTPLSTLRMGEIAAGVLPAGVLNVVSGGRDLGRWISEHEGIDKIAFTGSVATGRRVMASAATNLKRITLELGGNDAAIVLDDADPKTVAPALFQAAFINSGQICMAIKRLYVHDSMYDDLCERLAKLAREAVVGDGLDPKTQLGPVQNAMQAGIVEGILADTRELPVRILAGDNRMERPGYFFEPTIVADIAEGTRLVDEEPFGPVLPILRYTTIHDAVERANATHFGLGASVWSADPERGAQVASKLVAGTVWVNRHVGVDTNVPFGGAKQSGLGCEYGLEGLRQYMQATAMFIPKAA